MENSLQLTQEEIFLFQSALEEQIMNLRNRFEEEERYIHPAKKYEELDKKTKDFFKKLPHSNYKITCIND